MLCRSVARNATECHLIPPEEVETNPLRLPDMIHDKEKMDLNKIEKYFVANAWKVVLDVNEKKNKQRCQW